MKHLSLLFFLLGAIAAGAGKPPACPKYPMTVYVATGQSPVTHLGYGISGDVASELIDEMWYAKYVDGQGGIAAYVDTCNKVFTFNFSGTRKLYLNFPAALIYGAAGPASWISSQVSVSKAFLRGFFEMGATPGTKYTTMLPLNFPVPGQTKGKVIGAGLRYEPMSTDYNEAHPDFPTYPEINTPYCTWAALITALDDSHRLVTPTLVTPSGPPSCLAFQEPVATLLQESPTGTSTMVNMGQYPMDFRIIIEGAMQ